ncbi:hypothetical protein llap_12863 [Limosa lapponica baueri]|uniref:Uncharacterized protein n=1 Tax=Limosa lapponica baueri TaxID=1758121 RepID=A0A2I0TSW3_LIMLA|nr:hypothetical protein llap_12863 [Limosa lapponica baueri]
MYETNVNSELPVKSKICLYGHAKINPDERRAVDIVYQDFSRTLETVSHKIPIEKLLKYGLDEQTVRPTDVELMSELLKNIECLGLEEINVQQP